MHNHGISIWFFIGIMLTAYGALVLAYGLWELISGHLANVALAQLHAPVWWGALMLLVGLFYLWRFMPGYEHRHTK